jgi:hypothetical protein
LATGVLGVFVDQSLTQRLQLLVLLANLLLQVFDSSRARERGGINFTAGE